MKISYRIFLIAFLLISFSRSFTQTSAIGNYEIYTRETSMSSFGYLTLSAAMPYSMGNLTEKGIMYSYKYLLNDLGSVSIGYENEIRIFLEGNFNIGAGIAQAYLINEYPQFQSGRVNYYAGNVDFFSMDLTPEYTNVLSDGTAVTIKAGINFLNIGGSIITPGKGRFEDNSFGVLNLIPFSIKPSLFFDFGRSGVGFSFILNPTNFLSFIIAKKGLYPEEERGIQVLDSTFKRYSFQVLFTF